MKTVMIPVPNKTGTRRYTKHRTIDLIAHTAKILLRILNQRLVRVMEEYTRRNSLVLGNGKQPEMPSG